MRKLSGILLVDDDETNNFLNERILKKLDLADDIRIFKNGKQAYDYLKGLRQQPVSENHSAIPELIFLDINMPVMDGFEFLELFGQFDENFRKRMKIVILSTSSHDRDLENAKRFPIADYVIKPLSMTKILEIIERNFQNSTSVNA
jgi:CheY-like chemotaxis protein